MRGIGQIKLREFGDVFVQEVTRFCAERGLVMDVAPAAPTQRDRAMPDPKPRSKPRMHPAADALFQRGASMHEASEELARGLSTICNYLCQWIEETKPASVAPWVDDATYAKVTEAYKQIGGDRLRPIWDHLSGEVPYETIRIVLTHAKNMV